MPNGYYCDAAFYSTQWNKPFSTGIGGFLVVNNFELIDKVTAQEKQKVKPKFIEKSILRFLITFRKYFINKYTQSILVDIFRLLSKHNIVIGSNQGNELSGTEKPDDYFKDISDVQVKSGLKQIKNLEYLNKLRKKNAEKYSNYLRAKGKTYVSKNLFNDHIFLKYPLLVKDREHFFKLAQKKNITLGDWFLSPLHPIQGNLEPWFFDEDKFPNAVHIAKKMVNLPTEVENIEDVVEFLSKNLNFIE